MDDVGYGRHWRALSGAVKAIGANFGKRVLQDLFFFKQASAATFSAENEDKDRSMTKVLDDISASLQRLQLPSLTRPNIGPSDPPTFELVQFDMKTYAYSAIAYVRDLLDGFLILQVAQNVAAIDLVIRGLYEWTMQASYVDQQNRIPIKSGDYAGCRTIMDRVQSGNGWVKRHGEKYCKPPFDEEMPESLRIKHLVKSYKAHQLEHRGEENVEDDYSYLSEHAHPNSFCFLDLIRIDGLGIKFFKPTPGTRHAGIVVATMLDWSLCIYNILVLANEMVVRSEFVTMLERISREWTEVRGQE